MRSTARVSVCVLLALAACVGCVRRQLEILSRPAGAKVTFDGKVLEQRTPVRMPFTWYGTHEIIIEKEGYHRERLVAHVRPPWYDRFPMDFLTECVWPGQIDSLHTYPLVLVKEHSLRELSDAEKAAMKHGLLERADRFRTRAREIAGTPPPPAKAADK